MVSESDKRIPARITDNAMEVLRRRYLAKDENGNVVEDVDGMFRRVARAVAGADKAFTKGDTTRSETRFYDAMSDLRFMPNSPTLMNAGRPLGQLSACFVLPVGDSMEDIFTAVMDAALIHKSGGGTGFSFSRLRPEGSAVRSTGGVASGPVSFMKVFNAATEAVKQGGTRRGANMGVLRVDHPDIEQFINCKRDLTQITNFNISVAVTDEFMQAVAEDRDYDLLSPVDRKPIGRKNARKVFDQIVDAAWRSGEPGVLFLDRINKFNPTPALGEIESTNPCGEQILLPWESCNLGSINLTRVVEKTDGGYAINWDLLADTARLAVHFLDNVIEINNFPLEKIAEVTRSTRKIGLGVMGFADVLLLLGIPYNSREGVELARRIMQFVHEEGLKESYRLAEERGVFPAFQGSVFGGGQPVRNATITTIAPTGTISMICGCSSGVEPIFAYAYERNVMDGTRLVEVNPILMRVLHEEGLYTDAILHRIVHEGTVAHIPEIPEEIRRVFVCAHDITPRDHVLMQAAFQAFTDNAVSKTVNFPTGATRGDVEEVYLTAYREGCKGITVYRDGSRDSQVLNIRKEEPKPEPAEPTRSIPRPRPKVTQGYTERVKTGCGNLYVTVNFDENGICEIFTNTGKAGGCASQSEATARLCSMSLRSGIAVDEVIDQLKGIRCPSTVRQQGMECTSCPDGIARVLTRVKRLMIESGCCASVDQPAPETAPAAGKPPVGAIKPECPECGSLLEHEGGCVICRSCGYSKCG